MLQMQQAAARNYCSRYGGMKQIDPVGPNGQVIVDYSLYDARRAGFETVIFVIKHEIEETFKAAIGDRVAKVMKVKYAFQQLDELPAGFAIPEGRVKPWGTCHAVLAAKDLIDGPFAVINADDYYGPEAFKVIYDYLSTHADGTVYDYCMVSYLLKNTVSEKAAWPAASAWQTRTAPSAASPSAPASRPMKTASTTPRMAARAGTTCPPMPPSA